MEQIRLEPMTEEMYHTFFREYRNDPDLCLNPTECVPYVYSAENVERYIRRQQERGRICLGILRGEVIVGELKLYDIQPGECASLGITMKNPSYKDKGYGTRAEQLAIAYVFETLNIPTLYADAILTNTRSQHVLEKAGFRLRYQDEARKYYVMEAGK